MEDKIALITGAATGIGAAVARLLSKQDIRVAVCDLNKDAGQLLAEDIGGIFIDCDVTEIESVSNAFEVCRDQLAIPNYVHLNAGIMTVPTGDPYLAIEDVSIDQYRNIVGVNLDGVYFGLKTALPYLKENGGAITITASTAGLGVVPVDPMYTATKHAVIGLARAVAAANAESNVRINVICPGVTDTGIVPDEFRAPQYKMMPAEMIATEIADLLLNGPNGEVRVKAANDQPAFTAD